VPVRRRTKVSVPPRTACYALPKNRYNGNKDPILTKLPASAGTAQNTMLP
jgi:hypothetical protein